MKNRVKRILALLIATMVMISGVSCNNQTQTTADETVNNSNQIAFEKAKEAYDEITKAYEIIDVMAGDVYEGWYQSVIERKNLTMSKLCSKMSISQDDVYKGFDSYLTNVVKYKDGLSVISKYGDSAVDGLLGELSGDAFYVIIGIVCEAYKINGKLSEAQTAMDNAKTIMKEINTENPDYEYYSLLKGYYTSTNSLLVWCESPDGTFQQAMGTIKEYRNEIRDYQQELDFVFED